VWQSMSSYLEIPIHFIMERRLLMGMKARAEAGENVALSQTQDKIWFVGVVLSGLFICYFVFIARGIVQSIVVSSILSFFWMCSIWLVAPKPIYSLGMLLMVVMAMLVVIKPGRARGSGLLI